MVGNPTIDLKNGEKEKYDMPCGELRNIEMLDLSQK